MEHLSPFMFYLILSALLALLVLSGGGMLWAWKEIQKLRRALNIQQRLPFRIIVFDLQGKIRYFHKEQGVASDLCHESYATVQDIPWVNSQRLSQIIENVWLEQKKAAFKDASLSGCKYSFFMPLSPEMWGEPAVLCVASNMEYMEPNRFGNEMTQQILQMLQPLGHGFLTTDPDGVVVSLNPIAEQLTGWTRNEAVGQTFADVFYMVGRPEARRVPSPIAEALAGEGDMSQAGNATLIARDGAHYSITYSASPLFDGHGNITGAALIFRDVSQTEESQREMVIQQNLMRDVCELARVCFFKYHLKSGESIPLIPGVAFRPHVNGKQLPLEQWFTPESSALLEQELRAVAAGAQDSLRVQTVANSGGHNRYYRFWAKRSNVNADELIGISEDTTLENERQMELQDTLTLLNSVMNNLPYPIFTKEIKNEFRYHSSNQVFAEHCGRKISEVVGRTDFELWKNPADAEQLRMHDRSVAGGHGEPISFAEHYTTATGELYTCNSIKQVMTLNNGRQLLLGISVDSNTEERKEQLEKLEAISYQEQDEIIFSCLEKLISNNDSEVVIRRFAEMAGAGLGVGRCLIYQCRAEGEPSLCVLQEIWSADDNCHHQEFQMNHFPRSQERLLHGESICYHIQDPYPPDSWQMETHGYLKETGQCELVVVPIFARGKIWGMIGAEHARPEFHFSDKGLRLLKIAARLLPFFVAKELNSHQTTRMLI